MKNSLISIEDIFDTVNVSVDVAFRNQDYCLKFYEYLKENKCNRQQIESFINSSLFLSITHQIEELDSYIYDKDSIFIESYNWMGKYRATKLKDYLETIVNDSLKFAKSKKRGRPPRDKK